MAIPCDDRCTIELDQVQIAEIYDLINEKVRSDLQADYDCKKINGATYADTWAKMMSPTIGHIMSAAVTLATKETAADRAIKQADVDLKKEQGLLYARQAKGFDDNANQKLFDSQISAWSMVFADTDLPTVTSPLRDDIICESFQRVKDGLGDDPGIACEPLV